MTVLNHCLALLMLAGIVTGYTMPVTANNQVTGVYYSTPSNAAFQVPLSTMSSSLTTALADVVTIPNEALVIGFCGASNALTSVAALLLDDNGIAQDFVFKCTHIGLDTVVNNEDWLSNTYDDNVWTAPTNEGPADSVFNWPAGVTKPPWFTLGTPRMCCRYVFPFTATTTTTTPQTTTTTPTPTITTNTPTIITTRLTTTTTSTPTTTPQHGTGTCHCYGDPHCTTTDGFHFNLTKASCGMTLLRDGCNGGIPTGSENSYEVAVDIDNSGKHWFVEGVRIETGGHMLEMDSTPLMVKVNGIRVAQQAIKGSTKSHPVLKNGFVIYRTATKRVMVAFGGGVHVEWNFDRRVKTEVPSSEASHTCGICGNSDGDPYNDYVFGPSDHDSRCPAKSGTMQQYGVQAGDLVGTGKIQSRLYALSWYSYTRPGDVECIGSCHVQP